MLVAVFFAAIMTVIPVDLASLYFSFIQTLVALAAFYEIEEVDEMINIDLVESGTHGVVQEYWEKENCYKCAL